MPLQSCHFSILETSNWGNLWMQTEAPWGPLYLLTGRSFKRKSNVINSFPRSFISQGRLTHFTRKRLEVHTTPHQLCHRGSLLLLGTCSSFTQVISSPLRCLPPSHSSPRSKCVCFHISLVLRVFPLLSCGVQCPLYIYILLFWNNLPAVCLFHKLNYWNLRG